MTDTPASSAPRRRRSRPKARANGEGSVFQRADGRWCAVLSCGGGRRKSYYGATRAEALGALVGAREAQRRGQPLGDDRLTLAVLLERFLDERRARTRPATMTDYTNVVRRHLTPALGPVKVRKLTAADVQAFLEAKRGEVSPTMVRHIRTILRMALRLAVDWELVSRNVVDSVRGPKAERPAIDPLDAAETRQLLAKVRAHPLAAVWFLAATLGLRRGELLGLRWDAIDLDGGTLAVRAQLAHVEGEGEGEAKRPVLVEPKSKSGRRMLKLAPPLVAMLRERKAAQAAQRLRAGGYWRNDLGLVFTLDDGRPICGPAVSSLHTRLCTAAGVRVVRFHDLRHGAASLMLAAGVDPRTLSEALGHARVAFTLDTYAHVKRPRLDDAIDRLAAVVLPS